MALRSSELTLRCPSAPLDTPRHFSCRLAPRSRHVAGSNERRNRRCCTIARVYAVPCPGRRRRDRTGCARRHRRGLAGAQGLRRASRRPPCRLRYPQRRTWRSHCSAGAHYCSHQPARPRVTTRRTGRAPHALTRAEQAEAVAKAFEAQRAYLEFASACTKLPSTSPAFADKLGPTATALSAAVELKEKNRGSKEINFLNTVAEGIPALGWVQVVSRLASGRLELGADWGVVTLYRSRNRGRSSTTRRTRHSSGPTGSSRITRSRAFRPERLRISLPPAHGTSPLAGTRRRSSGRGASSPSSRSFASM